MSIRQLTAAVIACVCAQAFAAGEIAVKTAKANAVEAQVTLCENDLSYCTITSPINGILSEGDVTFRHSERM